MNMKWNDQALASSNPPNRLTVTTSVSRDLLRKGHAPKNGPKSAWGWGPVPPGVWVARCIDVVIPRRCCHRGRNTRRQTAAVRQRKGGGMAEK